MAQQTESAEPSAMRIKAGAIILLCLPSVMGTSYFLAGLMAAQFRNAAHFNPFQEPSTVERLISAVESLLTFASWYGAALGPLLLPVAAHLAIVASPGSPTRMNAYVCVYLRYYPARKHFAATEQAATKDPSLQKFLNEYVRDDCYLDWGDDPSFFSAREFLGDARRASWGVCRPNVRARLGPGDFVVFFCGKRRSREGPWCDYFFVGVGTVGEVLDRRSLSTTPYRDFYNVLAAPDGADFKQTETFHPFHSNWRDRLSAYIVFDSSDELTFFNLDTPLRVASYEGTVPERWLSSSSEHVARLEALLFHDRQATRRLRTSPTGFSHSHINLSRSPPTQLVHLRVELIALAKRAAQ